MLWAKRTRYIWFIIFTKIIVDASHSFDQKLNIRVILYLLNIHFLCNVASLAWNSVQYFFDACFCNERSFFNALLLTLSLKYSLYALEDIWLISLRAENDSKKKAQFIYFLRWNQYFTKNRFWPYTANLYVSIKVQQRSSSSFFRTLTCWTCLKQLVNLANNCKCVSIFWPSSPSALDKLNKWKSQTKIMRISADP